MSTVQLLTNLVRFLYLEESYWSPLQKMQILDLVFQTFVLAANYLIFQNLQRK